MSQDAVEKKTLLFRSLIIAGGLTLFKLGVFTVTNSMAILASAADSLMDALISFVNFILVRPASKPADHNHPYGHGKIESLAGLAQSIVIGGVTVGIAAMAVRRFLSPEPIEQAGVGIGVTVVALVLNIWHTRNLRSSKLKTSSQIMAAEYLHYASDTLVYIGVLVSLGLCKLTGQAIWDPVISLLIVGYLLKLVSGIFIESVNELLDRQLPEEDLKEIDAAIRAFDSRVAGYHDLRTRKVGSTRFIEFHVALRGVDKFHDAHTLTVGLMETFKEKYPGAVVTVHADPHFD